MNRNQLIELVKKIQNEDVKKQNEIIELVLFFEENVPDPNASDYIFVKKYEYMTPEQIVDKALSYNYSTLRNIIYSIQKQEK